MPEQPKKVSVFIQQCNSNIFCCCGLSEWRVIDPLEVSKDRSAIISDIRLSAIFNRLQSKLLLL
jgi:hypothetical protein